MGFRDTGKKHPAQPIKVLICDVCGVDIDGKAYYDVTYHDNYDFSDDATDVCSVKCLVTHAARLSPEVQEVSK